VLQPEFSSSGKAKSALPGRRGGFGIHRLLLFCHHRRPVLLIPLIVLACALLVASLAGCGNTVASPTGTGNSTTTTTDELSSLIAVLEGDNELRRTSAIEALGKMGGTRAIQALIAALEHDSADVRGKAAKALAETGDRRAVDPLIGALQDQSSDVRSWAAHALGTMGDPQAVDPLIVALRDEEMRVEATAAHALGEIADPRAVESLSATLQALDSMGLSEETAIVRTAVLEALGKIGDTQAVAALIAVVENVVENSEPSEWNASYHAAEGAALVLISMGESGAEQALVEFLQSAGGNTLLAQIYLNCGNPALEQAAEEWATARGLSVWPRVMAGGENAATWGESR